MNISSDKSIYLYIYLAVVKAFVIQTLDQINFTIICTLMSESLLLCMYMHRYYASIYIYIYKYHRTSELFPRVAARRTREL